MSLHLPYRSPHSANARKGELIDYLMQNASVSRLRSSQAPAWSKWIDFKASGKPKMIKSKLWNNEEWITFKSSHVRHEQRITSKKCNRGDVHKMLFVVCHWYSMCKEERRTHSATLPASLVIEKGSLSSMVWEKHIVFLLVESHVYVEIFPFYSQTSILQMEVYFGSVNQDNL